MSDIAERLFNFNFFTIIVEGRQGLLTVLQGKGLKELKIVEGQAIENISNLAQDNKVTYDLRKNRVPWQQEYFFTTHVLIMNNHIK